MENFAKELELKVRARYTTMLFENRPRLKKGEAGFHLKAAIEHFVGNRTLKSHKIYEAKSEARDTLYNLSFVIL
jgi:hypothetical protein